MAVSDLALSWKDHHNVLISVFEKLLEKESLVDCTLAADGKFLKAHKVVLSACSPYLEALLNQENDKHPIIFLRDVEFEDLKTIVEFVYCGEIKIPEDRLVEFLNLAEALQIKGLGSAESKARGTQHDNKPLSRRDVTSPVPRKRLRCDSKSSESNSCDNKETMSLKSAHRGKDRVSNETQVLNDSGVDSSLCKTDAVIEEITLQVPQIKEEGTAPPVVISSVRAEHSTVESVQCLGDVSSNEVAEVKPEFEHVTFTEDYSDILPDSGATEESVINSIHSEPSTSHAYTGFSSEQIESGGLAEQTSNLSGDSVQPPSEGVTSAGMSYNSELVMNTDWPNLPAMYMEETRTKLWRTSKRVDINIDVLSNISLGSSTSLHDLHLPFSNSHTCPMCQKKFSYRTPLIRHIRTHTGEKPFICEVCHMRFRQKAHLKGHMNTHTRNRQFVCKDCGEAFLHLSNLNYHRRRKHPVVGT